MKNIGTIFLLDLDETLVSDKSNSVSHINKSHIRKYLLDGGTIVIATGRNFLDATTPFLFLKENNLYEKLFFIVDDGMYVYNDSKVVYKSESIKKEELYEIIKKSKENTAIKGYATVFFQREEKTIIFNLAIWLLVVIKRVFRKAKRGNKPVYNIFNYKKNIKSDITKIHLYNVKKNKKVFFSNYNVFHINSKYYEILSKNTSKWNAAQNIAPIVNPDSDKKFFAVGNDENDIDMLKFSNYSYSFSYSPIVVKESSKTILKDNENLIPFLLSEVTKK